MKNINEYYDEYNNRYKYNCIVHDYILEYELYKRSLNFKKIIAEISNWFFKQNIKPFNLDVLENISTYFHESAIEINVHFFVYNHKELFIVGEEYEF